MIHGKEAQSKKSEIESVIFHFKWMMLAIYFILQVDEDERNENNLGSVIQVRHISTPKVFYVAWNSKLSW